MRLPLSQSLLMVALAFGPAVAPGQQRPDPIANAIDLNGDGSLSALELEKAAAAIRKLDKDGDNVVSRDEASGKESSTQQRGGGGRLGGGALSPIRIPPRRLGWARLAVG